MSPLVTAYAKYLQPAGLQAAEALEAAIGHDAARGVLDQLVARDGGAWDLNDALLQEMRKRYPETEPEPAPARSRGEMTKKERSDADWLWLNAMYEQPGIRSLDKLVAGYLWRRAYGNSPFACHPKHATIASACSFSSVTTAKSCLNRLKAHRLLDWRKGSFGGSNGYLLLPPADWLNTSIPWTHSRRLRSRRSDGTFDVATA